MDPAADFSGELDTTKQSAPVPPPHAHAHGQRKPAAGIYVMRVPKEDKIDSEPAPAAYVVRLPKDRVLELPLRRHPAGEQQQRKPAAPGTYVVRVPKGTVIQFSRRQQHSPDARRRSRHAWLFLFVATLCWLAVCVGGTYLVLRSTHPSDRPHQQ